MSTQTPGRWGSEKVYRRTPYSLKTSAWIHEIQTSLRSIALGRAASAAVLTWVVQRDGRSGHRLDWIPYQLAQAGGCATCTISRALSTLLLEGYVECLETPDHNQRRAGRYRFTSKFPDFASVHVQNAKCASPKVLRTNKRTNAPTHTKALQQHRPRPLTGALLSNAWEKAFGPLKNLLESIPSAAPLSERSLKFILSKSNLQPELALETLKRIAEIAQAKGNLLRDPRAWCLKAISDESFREGILRYVPDSSRQLDAETSGDPCVARLVAEGFDLPGAKSVARDLSPQVKTRLEQALASARQILNRPTSSTPVANPLGLLAHLLRSQDPRILKKLKVSAGVPQLDPKEWDGLPAAFRAQSGVMGGVEALVTAHKRVRSLSTDHPAYLDLLREVKAHKRHVVELALTSLGSQRAFVESNARARLVSSGLNPSSVVWEQAYRNELVTGLCAALPVPGSLREALLGH